MIAILGALLEENDADSRPIVPELMIPGEYTDMEISRVAIFSAVGLLLLTKSYSDGYEYR
jgi:origin recognition complex subunit 5